MPCQADLGELDEEGACERGLRAGVEFQRTQVEMSGCSRQPVGLCAACSRDGLEGAGGAVCPGLAGLVSASPAGCGLGLGKAIGASRRHGAFSFHIQAPAGEDRKELTCEVGPHTHPPPARYPVSPTRGVSGASQFPLFVDT